MPRNRPKRSTNSISDEILKEIKSIRPLRLFINKQKKKGIVDKPFSLRAKFCQLSQDKQDRYLQKSVNKYIELLDEKDVDESVQIQCKLFDHLLLRSQQKKYFRSINAPIKPPGTGVPYYTQIIKEENDDDENEILWKSLSENEQNRYKKKRKEAKMEYSAQVRNFANDLPERLRTDYLLFAEQTPSKSQVNSSPIVNGHDNTDHSQPIRKRRKSLASLPESLQLPSTDDTQFKLTKIQLNELHKCMPRVLYYETDFSQDEKPTFTRIMNQNTYIRSVFNQLNEEERLKYILLSIEKWKEFLQLNPNIIQNQIPTLHLLLPKNEDIILYYSSIGLPLRPPINSYLLYNLEKEQIDSSQSWTDLSQNERHNYSQQLIELKNEYYQKLLEFIEHILTTDYMKYEFFRNIKYAIKDYELASKNEIIDKNTGQLNLLQCTKKFQMNSDINQFNQIKQRLLSTKLTKEQETLVEELTQLLYKFIE